MRKFIWIFFLAFLLGFSPIVKAALYDRGGGLIYDDVLNITWLQDANHAGKMDWYNADNWTSNFVYGGYDSWRLPTTDDGIFQFGYDGVTNNAGYNMTNSEMSHLYYVTLGNLGYQAPDGTQPQPGWTVQNFGPFINIQSYYYSTPHDHQGEPGSSEGEVWQFNFNGGLQQLSDPWIERYVWPVHDGDIGAPIPIPGAVWLLGSGLIALVGLRRKLKKN